MSKATMQVMGYALAAFALAAFVQRNVMTIPVIGDYLPK